MLNPGSGGSISSVMSWVRSQSLWFYSFGSGCCADELMQAVGARYDLERFGMIEQSDPTQADLLIVSTCVTRDLAPEVRKIYDQMKSPKYVIAVGSCACKGGLHQPHLSYSVVPGLSEIVPVDVFVPGCPPRPETIMNGIISLKEKIHAPRR